MCVCGRALVQDGAKAGVLALSLLIGTSSFERRHLI